MIPRTAAPRKTRLDSAPVQSIIGRWLVCPVENIGMDARPFLITIAEALQDVGLEAILVGNAAAALHGAPVTTLDFDFMFRKTPTNLGKLKKLADRLDAVILRPYYPTSDLYRVTVEDTGLQLDFMSVLHGVRSFASLRSRAEQVAFGRARLWVANLDDVIASKRAVGRPRDLAVLDILEKTAREQRRGQEEEA